MADRLLFFSPLPAKNLTYSWHRDQGLLVETMRSIGYDAQLIGRWPEPEKPDERLIAATDENLHDPAWWQSLQPWAVITNTWGAPRFASIRQAILGATPRLLDRLDTDGARSPYMCWPSYLYRDWSAYRDFTKPHFRYLAFWHALGRGLARHMFPSLLDKRLAATLDVIPAVTAESPIATERMKRFQRQFKYAGNNIHLLPHPIDTRDIPDSTVSKINRVISVGRWESHQKNFPLLLRVLNDFLTVHPDWDAVLPGSRHPEEERLLRRYCAQTRGRIQITGPLPNHEIQRHMAESKIFLMASRHESFGIAAAEALCLGCSVVGPAHIPSIPWFCGSDSGTVATVYTSNGLLDALSAEAELWRSANRNAIRIAQTWRARAGAETVAREMVSLLGKFFA
jgi:glycosyltransferase involved in cell wall biosynthesis